MQVFKEFVTKATEALQGPAPESTKGSAAKSGAKGGNPPADAQDNSDTDQWLAGTNALKTEQVIFSYD